MSWIQARLKINPAGSCQQNNSNPIHQEYTALVAEKLKASLYPKDISALISPTDVYKLLPLKKVLVDLSKTDDFLLRRLKPVSSSIGAKDNAVNHLPVSCSGTLDARWRADYCCLDG
jgi:hypothetical protein